MQHGGGGGRAPEARDLFSPPSVRAIIFTLSRRLRFHYRDVARCNTLFRREDCKGTRLFPDNTRGFNLRENRMPRIAERIANTTIDRGSPEILINTVVKLLINA